MQADDLLMQYKESMNLTTKDSKKPNSSNNSNNSDDVVDVEIVK